MLRHEPDEVKRCITYFFFTTGILIVAYGFINIKSDSATYIIVTGVLVLIAGGLQWVRDFSRPTDDRSRRSPATSITIDPDDPPPAYQDTWSESYLENLSKELPPPAYRDSWSKGIAIQRHENYRNGQDNGQLLVLDPSTLPEDMAAEVSSFGRPPFVTSSTSSATSSSLPPPAPHSSPISERTHQFPQGRRHLSTPPPTPPTSSNTPDLEKMRSVLSRIPVSNNSVSQRPRPPPPVSSSYEAGPPTGYSSIHTALPSLRVQTVDDDLAVVTPSQLTSLFENRT